ncbi:porin [uncultured Massilia sp.]|uniref:porin n=1 Tax=uncultured Massilia sp. TaxID=169973 RepID=UPI0025DF90D3|nr:porin [uncultured Massilia sp.]
MNTPYLAAAVLAALAALANPARAQSSVSISGMLDVGLVHESGGVAGAATKVTSGVEKGSRLLFRGSEDLGGGTSAIFLLESGFQADSGTLGQGGLLFGRQAYVGLASRNRGTLLLGRQYTPNYVTMATVGDPFAAGLAGVFSSVFANSGGRMNNTVKYLTPRVRGWGAEFAYGAGEVAGSTRTGSSAGAALGYSAGRLNARLGYHYRNNDTATAQGRSPARNVLLAANYDFTRIKAYFAYGINRGLNSAQLPAANAYRAAVAPVASTDSRDLLLGATVPLGAGKLIASTIHKDDRGRADQDASLYALGYVYYLSKRTDLYVAYGYIDNRNGAGYVVNSAIDVGTGNRAFNLGMRHVF